MMQNSLQKKLFRFILLIGAAILLIAAFVVFPAVRYILELQNRIAATEEILETYYQKTRRAQKSLRTLEAADEQTDAYRQAALAKDGELEFITRLEALAKEHGVAQELSARFVDSGSAGGRPYYEFSFVNTGSFKDLLRHVAAIERMPEYLIVKSMEWKKTGASLALAPVTLSFQAIVYANLFDE